MKPKIVSCLRDIKTESCGPLTTFNSERDLIMSLQEFVRSTPEALPSQHPHDFQVLVVGSWDADTGLLKAEPTPTVMGVLFDFLPIGSNERKVAALKKATKKSKK